MCSVRILSGTDWSISRFCSISPDPCKYSTSTVSFRVLSTSSAILSSMLYKYSYDIDIVVKSMYVCMYVSIYLYVCLSVCLPTCLPISLWLYSLFVGPWPLFSFLVYYIVHRTSWSGDPPVSRPILAHTGQHEHRINAHVYSYLKRDSNLWSQCLSGRRQFMP
jgi:hypothetical protein